MSLNARVGVIVAALAAFSMTAAAQDRWVTRASIPWSNAGIYLHTVTACNGQMYVIGGEGAWGTTDECWRFNPSANSWSQVASLPMSISNHVAGAYGTSIFVFGAGYDWWTGVYTVAIWEYDTQADTWTQLPANLGVIPSWDWNAGCTVGSKIYICGGYDDPYAGSASTTLGEFDCVAKTMTRLGNGPFAAAGFCGSLGGQLYYMGGYGAAVLKTVSVYDSWSATWSPCADLPVALMYASSFTVGSRLYVGGGISDTAFGVNSLFEYEPASDTWTQRAGMARDLCQGGACAINGKGYWNGGQPYDYSFPTYEYTPPDFGLPPNPAANAGQFDAALHPVAPKGIVGRQIVIRADLSDPTSPTEGLRLDVQIHLVGTPWPAKATHSSAWAPTGRHEIVIDIPGAGDYEWRYRVIDGLLNCTPAYPGWTAGLEFMSDQTPPTAPIALAPVGTIASDPMAVDFRWTTATDDGVGLTYEVEVSYDGAFGSVITKSMETVTSWTTPLPSEVERFLYWRVRAIDGVGNVGAWSSVARFSFADLMDHGAGDAAKACGLSVGGNGASLLVLLALLAVRKR